MGFECASLSETIRGRTVYLFDWDGCAAQSLEAGYQVVAKRCAEFNLFPEREEIIRQYGNWNAAIEFGLPPELLDEYIEGVAPMFHDALTTAPLYPGFRQVLARLQERQERVAIVTSGLKRTIWAALEYHGLGCYAGSVVAAEDVQSHKPSPEPINTALGRLGASPDQAVVFGDSYAKDIAAAHAAGTQGVLFYPPEHHDIYGYNTGALSVPVITSWHTMLNRLQ